MKVKEDAQVKILPLADGGEGTVDALVQWMNGKKETIEVTGPIAKKVDATLSVQEKIDGIMPGILSIGVLFIYYYLISKKHVSVAKLVFFTIVIALLCAAIGLF